MFKSNLVVVHGAQCRAWLGLVVAGSCVACATSPVTDRLPYTSADGAVSGGIDATAGLDARLRDSGAGELGDDAGVSTAADGGSGSGTEDAGAKPPPSSGPGDWVAGDYPSDLMAQTYLELANVPGQNGNTRQYKVHVPPSYQPSVPMPLVFCFHGVAQNAVSFCVDGSGMNEKSDAEGFILVMPNGFQSSWNGGTCCGAAADTQLDDVALVRAIFDEVKGHLNVNLARVYATGLSNGGYLSYRLGCQAADIFAAIAPGSGGIGTDDIGGGTRMDGDLEACNPSQPVSLLDIHGTGDNIIAYSVQKPSLEQIAAKNGCKLTTHAASQPKSGGDTTCLSYDGCANGIDVTGCSVMNGGHVWFGDENCGTGIAGACAFVGANSDTLVNTDAVWAFFEAHSR